MNNLQKAAEFGSAMGKMSGSAMNKSADLGTKPGIGEIEKVVKPPVNPGIALETPKHGPNEWNPEFFSDAAKGGAKIAPSLAGAGASAVSSLTGSPVLGLAAKAISPLIGMGASHLLNGASNSIDRADKNGFPIMESVIGDAHRNAIRGLGLDRAGWKVPKERKGADRG